LAFYYWAECGVDVVCLETGLGGLYDSTNIVRAEQLDLTCITSIGLDHMEILGCTEREILINKAGIFKPKVPILIGNTVDFNYVESRAKELNCELYAMKHFLGDYQLENKELVKMASEILKEKYDFSKYVEIAFDEPMIGRYEKIPQSQLSKINNRFAEVVLDVGHNP
jgi:dihydrofolate synthase / folylpolyglutamate synthase